MLCLTCSLAQPVCVLLLIMAGGSARRLFERRWFRPVLHEASSASSKPARERRRGATRDGYWGCQADQLSHGREPSETGRVMVGAAGSASGGPLKSAPASPGSLWSPLCGHSFTELYITLCTCASASSSLPVCASKWVGQGHGHVLDRLSLFQCGCLNMLVLKVRRNCPYSHAHK